MKKILLFLILIIFSWPVFAATLWVNPAGSATSPYDTEAKGLTTIQAGMAAMSANDTLMIADGTYTGASNIISEAAKPPNGSAGGYTTIQAETTGGVIIDGETVRDPLSLEDDSPVAEYIIFRGIHFTKGTTTGEGNVRIGNANHIKLIGCASSEAADGTHLFSAYSSTYILYEDCFGWGHAEYGFHFRDSSYCIARRCVARIDRATSNDPFVAAFFSYWSNYVEFQNCISIDMDQTTYLDDITGGEGYSFKVRNGIGSHIAFRGCIALNTWSLGGTYSIGDTGTDITIEDSVAWGGLVENDNVYLRQAVEDHTVNHIVVGGNTVAEGRGVYHSGGVQGVLTNSIVTGINGTGISNLTSASYIVLHDNDTDSANLGLSSNLITNVNPYANSLFYLVKIESGSDLITAGSDSTYIGAEIIYQIGSSETLYDETGYATETVIKMWPFPNEELIRSKMAAYTWDDGSGGDPEITGARGFTTTSLTGYILNYLEPTNTITVTSNVTSTDDVNEYIYGESGETDEVDPIVAISDSDPKVLTSGYTTTLEFTAYDASGIDECKWRSGSAPDESNGTLCTGTTSGTCSVTGLVQGNNTIYVGCADPSNNWGSDSITVNAPSYRAQAGGTYNVR